MKLYLVRHGEAKSKAEDPERSLSPTGREGIRRVAGFLSKTGMSVPVIYHSGKKRAAETAEILASKVAPGVVPQKSDGLSPNDPLELIEGRVEDWTRDTMLVGHLPYMADLATRLLLETTDEVPVLVLFNPGTVLCLERDRIHGWYLEWVVHPGLFSAC